jgi:hypothetical protein
MADSEHEPSPDEFEIEISDLGPQRGRRGYGLPRLTPRQRRVSVVLTVLLFVLVIGTFLGGSPEVRGLLARTLLRPQPTATASSDSLSLYVQGNPSWGHFIVDGRPIAHLPALRRDRPLVLAQGQHTIIWQVAPFNPQTCILTVLNATTLSGPCLFSSRMSAHFVPGVNAMVLSFFASLNELPAGQRRALLQQIQQALASYETSESVHVGERYAVAEQQIQADPSLCSLAVHLAICSARAQQPLQASLHVQLDSSTSTDDPCVASNQCSFNHQDCRVLCEDPTVVYSNREIDGWSVAATVSLSWSYATLSGQVIASGQPISAVRGTQGYQMVSLHITRSGQDWQVSPFRQNIGAGYDDPLCNQAAQDTEALASIASGNQNMFVQNLVPVNNRAAEGCLVVLASAPGTILDPSTPVPAPNTQLVAYCLVRFGVVLAVNQVAHQQWPFLPMVDGYENSLANAALATIAP